MSRMERAREIAIRIAFASDSDAEWCVKAIAVALAAARRETLTEAISAGNAIEQFPKSLAVSHRIAWGNGKQAALDAIRALMEKERT